MESGIREGDQGIWQILEQRACANAGASRELGCSGSGTAAIEARGSRRGYLRLCSWADFHSQCETVAGQDTARKIVNVGQRSAAFCVKRTDNLQGLALFGDVQRSARSGSVVFKLKRQASVRVLHAVN